MTKRVLILTSSMGAGHDGVSHELALRLRRRGFDCSIMDMVEVLPFRIGRMIRSFYAGVIHWTPWLYEWIYRKWLEPAADESSTMSPITVLLEKRIASWVAKYEPAAVVSTFPVCTQTIGAMRARGSLQIPAVNVIVDFSVHGAWVSGGIDLHLCLHDSTAARVRLLLEASGGDSGSVVVACGPTVREEFRDGRWDPPDARASLGLGAGDRVALVVGGSWGAGGVTDTIRILLDDRRFVPLVVCGNNPRLRRRAESLCDKAGRGVVLGWVDDMWRLMVATDVMVENAGGLTAMEAAASGIPLVSYRPIPGHGVRCVEAMAAAGVSTFARTPRELIASVDILSATGAERDRQIVCAAAMFKGDIADEIVRLTGKSTAA